MSWFKNYLGSSIGMKQLMGATGLGLVGFVFIHMLGNLQVFMGQQTFNEYPVKLQNLGGLLWMARAGLLVLFVTHVFAGLRLWWLNSRARPLKYAAYKPKAASSYGRYMGMLGLVILAFVVYHLMHFTFGVVDGSNSDLSHNNLHDLYSYVILGFQNVPIAISYLVANTLLCLHLLHGLPSLFQSAGLRHPKYNSLIDRGSLALVTLIFVGNTSIVLAVLLGVLPGKV